MRDEWRELRLSDVFDFRSGLSKPRAAFGSGYAFLTFKDVFYNTFVPDVLGNLVASSDREREQCSIRCGDVFLTRTSETQHELAMSSVALRDYDSATFNGFCKRLRPKRDAELLPEYAGYYFRGPTFRRAVSAFSSLSTRASLNEQMLERLTIVLPPMAAQVAIAGVLKALDDKIELNRRMNETLEAMARALFKSWFVDFDPVRAKKEGRQPHGMDAATAGLFPADFEESELGSVPRGWEVKAIGDVARVVGGSTPSTENPVYWNGEHAWTRPKDLSQVTEKLLLTTERTITGAGLSVIGSGLLPRGTVLLSSRAPIGYTAIARIPVAINQGYIGILCSGDLTSAFTLFWLETAMEEIKGRAGGTTFPEISKQAFRTIRLLVPRRDLLDAFERHEAPLFDRVEVNVLSSRNLAALRDALLPKLLSGELRVPEAERIVGKAV